MNLAIESYIMFEIVENSIGSEIFASYPIILRGKKMYAKLNANKRVYKETHFLWSAFGAVIGAAAFRNLANI